MNGRPGFYVESRYFSPAHRAQAIARAEFLATEYGRDVHVIRLDYGLAGAVHHTARAVMSSMSTMLLQAG